MTQQRPSSRSMDDAIARVKEAATAREQRLAGGRQRQIFHTDLRIPDHPHARAVRRAGSICLAVGAAIIIVLPGTLFLHTLAFALMFGLIFLVAPNITLRASGAISVTKLIGWCGVLLFLGAMTSVAAGTTGNLWSWAPWLQQFTNHGHS